MVLKRWFDFFMAFFFPKATPKIPTSFAVELQNGEIWHVCGSRGPYLLAKSPDGSRRLVRMEDTIDWDQFWNLWDYLNSGNAVTWGDGTPVRREDFQKL